MAVVQLGLVRPSQPYGAVQSRNHSSYVASPHFGTSFLPSAKDESAIHGPFVRTRISSDDFILFEEAGLQPYLDQLLLSPE